MSTRLKLLLNKACLAIKRPVTLISALGVMPHCGPAKLPHGNRKIAESGAPGEMGRPRSVMLAGCAIELPTYWFVARRPFA